MNRSAVIRELRRKQQSKLQRYARHDAFMQQFASTLTPEYIAECLKFMTTLVAFHRGLDAVIAERAPDSLSVALVAPTDPIVVEIETAPGTSIYFGDDGAHHG